ncbi:puratrophin-1 isoform X2 [Phyllopteryx taeniolatus]|uniref:puratrophin-1 isoform X2 n=1 Tax=Phyllopteryx taeniolatus TaxID=161469 RepID=UPI002AD2FC64|nr:puratrophin-1 isoform X2 [Phyllopteryx taeniolatus]
MAWLDSVNVERPGVSGPRRRLLSAQRDVFRVTSPEDAGGDAGPEADRRAARGESEESEGGYVAVTEMRLPRFSPQEGSLTQAVARDGTGHRTHTPSDRVPSGRRSRDPAAPNAQTERRQWTKASEQRRRGGEDADEDVLRWEKDETATGGEREREERRDRTEAAGKPGAAEAAPRREVRPTIRTGSGRGGDGGKKQAKGGPEGQEEKDSYFEKTTHARDPCPEKWRRRNTDAQDFGSQTLPQNIHTGDSYSEKLPQQNIHTEDFYSEKLPEQIQTEGSYSEKLPEQIPTEDSYSEMLPQQNIHTEDFYSEKLSEQIQTEGSYSEKLPEQTHNEDSYSENLPQKNIHIEDSYSEKLPQQNIHTEDFYSEKFPEQIQTEGSYSEKLPEQTHNEDSYSENLPQKNIHIEDSYSEKLPQQNIHTEDFYSETLPEQIQTEGSYSEKLPEQIPTEDSYSEKLPQQNIHTEDFYSEKLPEQIQTEGSYSEKLPEQIPTEDSYSEMLPQQNIHTEDFYSEKLPEQIQTEGSYSEKLPEQTHNEDSYSENLPQQNIHNEDFYSEKLPEQIHAEDFCSEKLPVQNIHNEDFHSETVQTKIHTEGSYCEKLPEQIQQMHSLAEDSYFEDGLAPVSIAARTKDSYCERKWQHGESYQSLASFQSGFSRMLLRSGVIALPGSRDRSGRALLTVDAGNGAVWSRPECRRGELLRLMLYYASTLSAADAPAVTALVDARRAAPAPALLAALEAVQEELPNRLRSVLVLIDRDADAPVRVDKRTQVEVLTSLECLAERVDLDQLPGEFGGSFRFSHSSWLAFRYRVEQLTNQCEDVIQLLRKNVDIMEDTRLPDTRQDAERQLSGYRALMSGVLGDGRLARLQREGGTSLSLLRRDGEGEGGPAAAAAADAVSHLYERADELLHRLVAVNNGRTRQLNFIRDFWAAADAFAQVRAWMEGEGELRLRSLGRPDGSPEALRRKRRDFRDFCSSARARCEEGEVLLRGLDRWRHVWTSDLRGYEVRVGSMRARLREFSRRVDAAGRQIDKAVALYRFLDHAYGWAIKSRHRLAAIAVERNMSPEQCRAAIGSLEEHGRHYPPIPEAAFQEMKALADELRDERGLRQLSFARATCREARATFDKKMADARSARDSARERRSRLSAASAETLSGAGDAARSPPEAGPPSAPVDPRRGPLLWRLFGGDPARPRLHSSAGSTPCSFPRLLRKTQSFDCPAAAGQKACRSGPPARALGEPARRGNTGVFIRGLEVSSTECAERNPRPRPEVRAGHGRRGPGTPGTPAAPESHSAEGRGGGRKLRHIVEEMVTTERKYVRSLRYVIDHYFPEMEREDLPQDLRGKRFVVFGNLEKLLDFHSQFFLKELEACWKHPLRVSQCFLRHQEQFSLYALYSKNKPKSDALLANHGLAFFKRKQRELADKMDLCSYLLKPVQRMSKYALLLDDLIKEVGAAQEAELTSLQKAVAMVKFQLRHGNDLLAMDAIRHCDVNLKEQGQLLRQDQFTVWTGRRKCERRVFLFDELLLLSKAKKMDGRLDIFVYKHSFKTADLGLTESRGDDGLCFAIWFRRRTSKNQTLTLQAASADVKRAWTHELTRILWTQATRNKEARLKEMLSMGVGNKPYLDIRPSAAAISDRAVHYITGTRGARTRASIAVSASDRADPFKRVAPTSDPSSSSLLGSLNLHVFHHEPPGGAAVPAAGDAAFGTSPCIEEDEREHETASQPSMTTESSGSSSRRLSGSTGSDSGCASSSRLPDPSSASSSRSSRKPESSRARTLPI